MESQRKNPGEDRPYGGSGWWLPFVGVAAYALCGDIGYVLGKDIRFGPSSDVRPWYFLRHDFVAGVSLGLGLALCLAIAILARKRYPANASLLAWMSILWSGGPAWKAAVVWYGSHDLMNPEIATTRWASFDAYMGDPIIWAGQATVWIGVIVYFVGSQAWRLWRPAAKPVAP